jgi:YVTN family beta-propeller protein
MSRSRWACSGLVGLVVSLSLTAAAPAAAQTATAAVGAGTSPFSVAVNPVTNKIYVANSGSDNVTVIDGATNATITVAAGTNPVSVAVNPVTNKIYVANEGSGNVTVIDGATNATTTVAAGTNPVSVAVNPVTNKIYVANQGSANVTVIDGATNTTTTVAAGTNPRSVAVNPVTNKIYVANGGSDNVTVIDGATNATTTVRAGSSPVSVAVNPVTNKIYVANSNSNNVTVIDGATNATTTVAAGTNPVSVAVNPVTNKIYVANSVNNVTVIDGATNATTTVAAGTYPYSVAVNPVTNKIYVANSNSNNVTVIDGATNATTTVAAGTNPVSVAVNPVTNRIYVANSNSNNVTVIDGATNATTTVVAGSYPYSVAVNPVTNRIYVANSNSNNVTVIDGATNATTTVAAGTNPRSVAVNPVTNKIYVANYVSDNVTVIDGATNATTTVAAGTNPVSVAVNPVTNKFYVANVNSGTVTVIDGATNATTTVAAGTSPYSVAVNPVTNKVYVANYVSANVTVIDGATNATTTVAAGTSPYSVAVNPVTNKIYVANEGSGNVTVIDGATNATTTVVAGSYPYSVAVNPVTNKIYVANAGSANVTVIDGATNATTTVAAGTGPRSVAVNPVTNRIYVANFNSNNVTVIDGATNATTTVAAGTYQYSIAVNPVTNKIYVANGGSASVTVLTEQAVSTIPLTTTISPLAGNVTGSTTPTFTLSAASAFAPTAPPVQHVFTQVDTWQGSWQAATPSAGVFTATMSPLGAGTHVLYAYAVDGQDGTGCSNGNGSTCSPLIGSIAAYVFTVVVPPPAATVGSPQTICAGGTTSSLGGNTPGAGETGLWSVESGGTGTFAPGASTPNATFTHTGGTGPVLLRWTVSHPPFAASSATVSVTVNPVPAAPTAGSNSPRCAGSTLNLTASTVTGAAYAWIGPNGFTSTLQNPTISNATTAMAGTYSVTATVNGCAGTSAPTAVTVNPLPATPVVTAPARAYPWKTGLTASVEAHAGASYQWSVTNGSDILGQGTSAITFTAGSVGQTVLSVVETNALGCASAAGVATVTVGSGVLIPATGGAPNTTVDVPVNAASVSGLASVLLTIGYDPAALRFVSVRTGLLTPGWALLPNASNPGEIRVALASASGLAAGSGSLLYVAFDVIGSPGTTSNLTLSSVSLNDGAIVPDVTNGTFRIDVLRNVSGTVRYWNGGAGVPGVSLSLSGERVYSTSSSSSGDFTVGGLDGQTYVLEPSKSDGVDGIGTLDASLILQHAVGLTTLTGYAALAADVNGSGTISPMDAFLVLQKTIDAIPLPFPGAGRVWAFSPASRSYAPLSADQTGQDFTAILIGDVNGSWGAPPPAKTGPVPDAAGRGVASSDVVVKVADALSCGAAAIPVAVTVIPPGAKVLGVALKITFDPAAMTISSVAAAGDAVSWAIASRQPEAGTLLVALAGASELAGPGTILLLSATPLKDGTSVVSLPSVSINDGEIPASGAPGNVSFISAVPSVTVSSNSPVCVGGTIILFASAVSGATYAWTGPNGFTSSQQNPTIPNATSAMSGAYSVTVAVGGCTSAAGTTSVTVGGTLTLQPILAPVVVGSSNTLSGCGFTAGSRIMMFVATASGASAHGPYTPTSWTNANLVWFVDSSIGLGNGFATFMVVNTDQGYIQSNTQSALLQGTASQNIPTITALNGVPLRPMDPSIPTANVETVITQGTTVTLTGTGFSNTLVNLFTAAGNKGPLTPLAGATSTQIQVVVPADTPTGPGSFQAVNSPYTGNVLSNAVSVPIGSLVTISHISLSGNVVTVTGTGFCTLTVINLFAQTASGVQNLGGLNGSGSSNIPLTIDSETQFHFTRPAAALAGPAYVMAINPPFIAYSSSGVGPSGGFLLP